jgi:nucleotide-binding universal stress UspA family protein
VYERILVPMDGSGRAELAIPHVEQLADRFGAEVILIWVVVDDAGGEGSSPAERYLDGLQTRLQGAGAAVRSMTVVAGDAAGAILRVADEEQVSLICMTTHGLGGIRRLVLGSVADEVVRRANVPVLLVRPGEDQ